MKHFILGLWSAILLSPLSPVSGQDYLFGAGQGVISTPFILTNGYVFQAEQTDATNGGKAVYSFTTEAARQEYLVCAVVETPSPGALLVGIDADPVESEMKWTVPVSTGFATNVVTVRTGVTRYFSLTNGVHQLIIRGCDPNVKFRSVLVSRTSRPAPPTGLRVVGSP